MTSATGQIRNIFYRKIMFIEIQIEKRIGHAHINLNIMMAV